MKTKIFQYKGKGLRTELVTQQFIALYKEVFAGAPYFEEYEDDWVYEFVWQYHLLKGCIVLASDEKDALVGISCAIGLDKVSLSIANDSKDHLYQEKSFLLENASFNIDSTIYMSEIAVLSEFRGQGIGTRLIIKRWLWGFSQNYLYYAMRTAAKNSNSYKIYERLGAESLDAVQDISDYAQTIKSASDQRIYLYGTLS